MPARRDLTGMRFGRLVIVRDSGERIHKSIRYLCRCDCGREKIINGAVLRAGRSKSCGCLSREMTVARNKNELARHRLSYSAEYRAWRGMWARCNNQKNLKWHLYGGRGIKVCDHWAWFLNFYNDMGPRPSPNHSLDRWPDNAGNYEPDNCRWATASEQNLNRIKSVRRRSDYGIRR